MRKTFAVLLVTFIATLSLPAAAGPNWDLIHKAESEKDVQKHEDMNILPLDHGPRALSTPWLNQQKEKEIIAERAADHKLAARQAHSTHKSKVADTSHLHGSHASHS